MRSKRTIRELCLHWMLQMVFGFKCGTVKPQHYRDLCALQVSLQPKCFQNTWTSFIRISNTWQHLEADQCLLYWMSSLVHFRIKGVTRDWQVEVLLLHCWCHFLSPAARTCSSKNITAGGRASYCSMNSRATTQWKSNTLPAEGLTVNPSMQGWERPLSATLESCCQSV